MKWILKRKRSILCCYSSFYEHFFIFNVRYFIFDWVAVSLYVPYLNVSHEIFYSDFYLIFSLFIFVINYCRIKKILMKCRLGAVFHVFLRCTWTRILWCCKCAYGQSHTFCSKIASRICYMDGYTLDTRWLQNPLSSWWSAVRGWGNYFFNHFVSA